MNPIGYVLTCRHNGSVLKIEMDPRGVAGSVVLEAAAKKMSAKLDLKTVHWYLEKRKGLRFPSSAEFFESYVFDRKVSQRRAPIPPGDANAIGGDQSLILPYLESLHRRVKFYRMSQTYKKYRYFEVDTQVKVAEQK